MAYATLALLSRGGRLFLPRSRNRFGGRLRWCDLTDHRLDRIVPESRAGIAVRIGAVLPEVQIVAEDLRLSDFLHRDFAQPGLTDEG